MSRRLELVLRPVTVAEVPAVLELWLRAAENADRPDDSARAVEALLDRDPDALISAWSGPDLVGTVVAGWDGWRCHLYRLAVAPEHRRQGIAGSLVAAAEDRCRRLGGIRVDAMVLDDNETAHRAWRSAGYRRQAEWSRWIKPMPVD
ncbi:GNAT family N-acetyltransferase [Plantactinospora soyae]|uniref:Ribosomal protein S18 acetylase RimI-like enzyme n=1 Tax=Plantactinospora soyae TaxID=1544732 RepID=A0A927R8S1_9ACTN|nr:GNAT family N-acetyltransferase [Plantactinospora soyae]MBE1489061.1 ribosomal protein S18 acetylase RimI-like enzyme [Plantactinospora soyae]